MWKAALRCPQRWPAYDLTFVNNGPGQFALSQTKTSETESVVLSDQVRVKVGANGTAYCAIAYNLNDATTATLVWVSPTSGGVRDTTPGTGCPSIG